MHKLTKACALFFESEQFLFCVYSVKVGLLMKEKQKVDSMVIAETLFAEYIDNASLDFQLKIDATEEEKRNKKFLKVREMFDTLVFARFRIEKEILLQDLKNSMKELSNLISPSGKEHELTWAKTWLAGAGINETNPATLALFAFNWMGQFSTITKSL